MDRYESGVADDNGHVRPYQKQHGLHALELVREMLVHASAFPHPVVTDPKEQSRSWSCRVAGGGGSLLNVEKRAACC
jgi:hypothetical protein